MKGGVEIFGFADLFFWFGFSVFALQNCGFSAFGVFAGLLQFSLWFSVFVNNDCGFLDFSVQCIQYGFSGFVVWPFLLYCEMLGDIC